MDTLSERMKREAVEHGLCEQWTDEWSDNTSNDELVDKFVRGIDFCIKNDWPSVDEIETVRDVANKKGVYVNQYVALQNPSFVVLNGKCNAVINVTMGSSVIWVRHDSICSVSVSGGATAYIRCVDNAKLNVTCGFFSKAFTYKYSDGVEITAKGDVRMRERIDFYKK